MSINQFAGQVVSVATANDIEPAALLAVVEVESSGVPFEPDGVTMRFLFERHIFYRQLRDRAPSKLQAAVDQDLAYATRQPTRQYLDQKNAASRMALLTRARAIDTECANRSCSWGLGQVMGFNAPSLGYADATSMIESVKVGGVTAQITLMVKVIKNMGIASALNTHDWARFARRYNGSGYRSNDYDGKLARAYVKWRNNVPAAATGGGTVPVPAPAQVSGAGGLAFGTSGENVRQLQLALQQQNFPVGDIDGDFGPRTRDALAAFQRAHNIPATGVADNVTLRALGLADPGIVGGAPHDDAVRLLIREILKRTVPGAPSADGSPPAPNVLKTVLDAITGARGVPGSAGETPPLSAIDKALGGEALVGKKTAISVIGYVLLTLLKVGGVVGAATPAGQIITIALGVLGALGGTAKIDRAIQSIGMIVAKK